MSDWQINKSNQEDNVNKVKISRKSKKEVGMTSFLKLLKPHSGRNFPRNQYSPQNFSSVIIVN